MSLPGSFSAISVGVLWQSVKKAAGGVARVIATNTGRKAHGAAGNSHLLRWLMSLGGAGLFLVAIVDSSVIPLPLPGSSDLLLLVLASHRNSTVQSAAWLSLCTFAGSMIGGYLTWSAGCKGGQKALERYVPKRVLGRVTGWVEKHGAWSVGLAALLPPPVPLTPFVLAAGALKVTRRSFLVFYGIARAIRYALLGWLAVTYGRHMVRVWQRSLEGAGPIIVWVYVGLVAVGIGYGVWKFRKGRQTEREVADPAGEAA
jgi:membrane protein YqaA with SNARE-associated domain